VQINHSGQVGGLAGHAVQKLAFLDLRENERKRNKNERNLMEQKL